MDIRSTTDQYSHIATLQQQVQTLYQSVGEMKSLLDQYVTTEQALRHSEEQFRILVTAVRDYAIFMLDPQGYIASWNTGAQLIKGYHADEIIGRHFSIFYPPSDVAAQKPERELEIAMAEGVYKEEGWRLRKDGTSFWASVVITALYDDGVLRGFGKVTRDLSERKLAEEAQEFMQRQELQLAHAQEARKLAEENVQIRDSFLRATAHELRTPVTSLMGYAQLLQRRVDRGELTPERLQKPAQTIAIQTQRLDRLTTMLLDVTRLEAGKIDLGRAPLDVRRGIEQVVYELQLMTDQRDIVLHLPEAPLMIEANDVRFEQVIYNLIQNAIKYSPVGSTIQVTAQQEEQRAVVTVADEGIGIPPEDLPHVFERFYRATNISDTSVSGLGLGLYLVKEFVEMQDGAVEVQSAIGQGTTFHVFFPLVVPSQEGS